jgi:hypothetical protein
MLLITFYKLLNESPFLTALFLQLLNSLAPIHSLVKTSFSYLNYFNCRIEMITLSYSCSMSQMR